MSFIQILVTVTASFVIFFNTHTASVQSTLLSFWHTVSTYGTEDIQTYASGAEYALPETKLLTIEKPSLPSLANISFTPQEFVDYFDSLQLPHTTLQSEFPSITGDATADAKIIAIAKLRGYTLRPVADSASLVSYQGAYLQQPVIHAWEELKATAKQQGFSLAIVSGYRSVQQQRSLFTQRLQNAATQTLGHTLTSQAIASGSADAIVDRVLQGSSIPGTSKHHTGYTMDITDSTTVNDFTRFSQTPAFTWLSADNYANAKRFGFLPSYPQGAKEAGPEPEAWEFVWVGDLGK